VLDGRVAGFFEVQADLTAGGALSRPAGWADVWELHVEEDLRRRGNATWLVGHGADWLRLARAERLIDYVILVDDDAHHAFATAIRRPRAHARDARLVACRQRSALTVARAATSTGSYTPEYGGA
jgi:GNAT superfamily N-acetyltransferase